MMRKQVYELTPEDLDFCPIWEFALDEEEVEGQDEATVRPRTDLTAYEPAHSGVRTAMVKTELVSQAGIVYYGYCTPAADGDIGNIHPVIVTERGQVGFYFGALNPSADELAAHYERLGTARGRLFPIRFRSLVPAPGLVTSGSIPAFLRRTVASEDLIEMM